LAFDLCDRQGSLTGGTLLQVRAAKKKKKLTAEVCMAKPASDVEDEPGENQHCHSQPDPPACKQLVSNKFKALPFWQS